MAEPGRFSLERIVAALPTARATISAAILAIICAVLLSREAITSIPELVETSYGYDAQLRATHKNRSVAIDGPNVTFVDVDDSALQKWSDASRTTPREKIARIVEQVAGLKPALIFLDFDASGRSTDDDHLQRVLSSYTKDGAPLLLTREIHALNCAGDRCDKSNCETEGAGIESPSPFAEIVAKNSNIRWVSAVFSPDDDGVVRSWRLFETVCRSGDIVVLPSAQLAASALSDPSRAGYERLDAFLRYAATDNMASGPRPNWPKNQSAYNALIPFLIGGDASTSVSDWQGASGFRYQRVRAEALLADQVATSAIENRIIVIGASYGADQFRTPFGIMPGAALVSNAIAVAPSILNTKPVAPALLLVISLFLAVAYGLIAKTFRAIPAALIILALSSIWLSAATFLLNPADAVHTVSFALIVLGAFLAIESVLEIGTDILAGKGWGVIFRKRQPHGAAEH